MAERLRRRQQCRQTRVDALTGLRNRAALVDLLRRQMLRSAMGKEPLTVLMVDIDHFRRFAWEFGHQAGEEVLYTVAQILQDQARPTDIAARLGGDHRTVCGTEALVRWIHPQHGMMPPDEFIPLAEHTGLIKPLTDWVLAAALRQSSAWREAGLTLPVAVNLSARNLREAGLLNKMKQLFLAWGASAEWLELEITESAIMDDPDGALKVLTNLNNLGIALFIDDFGTGYSSLGYLQRLPVDAVKIDKSFVKDMLANADSAAIVRATITLAHDLGAKIVAEGVENQEMWDHLVELGCDVAQGYFIAKPMPADQFEEWLARPPWQPGMAGAGDHQAGSPARRARGAGGGRRR